MKVLIVGLVVMLFSSTVLALGEECPKNLKDYNEAMLAAKSHAMGVRQVAPSKKTLTILKDRVEECCDQALFDRHAANSAKPGLIKPSTVSKLDARVNDYCR